MHNNLISRYITVQMVFDETALKTIWNVMM